MTSCAYGMVDLPGITRCQLCLETAANYVVKPDTAPATEFRRYFARRDQLERRDGPQIVRSRRRFESLKLSPLKAADGTISPVESESACPRHAGLHHLGISVTNLDRSIRFYCDVLGADLLRGYN
jgi:hypothetical protein